MKRNIIPGQLISISKQNVFSEYDHNIERCLPVGRMRVEETSLAFAISVLNVEKDTYVAYVYVHSLQTFGWIWYIRCIDEQGM